MNGSGAIVVLEDYRRRRAHRNRQIDVAITPSEPQSAEPEPPTPIETPIDPSSVIWGAVAFGALIWLAFAIA